MIYEYEKLFNFTPTTTVPKSILEVLRVNEDENKHSDMIAWMLDANGPFKDNWFLKELLKKIGSRDINFNSVYVKREASSLQGYADIKIELGSYTLLIENKINSSESENQCKKYLEDHGIYNSSNGKLIFLSQNSEWPKSIKNRDPRVNAMSYSDIRLVLEDAQTGDFKDKFSEILVEKYKDLIINIMGLPMQNIRPIPSFTMYLINNQKKFEELKKSVEQYSKEFMQKLFYDIEIKFKDQGWLTKFTEDKRLIYCRKKDWKIEENDFGIFFRIEGGLKIPRLLSEYKPIIGMRVRAKEIESKAKETLKIREIVRAHFLEKLRNINNGVEPLLNNKMKVWPFYFNIEFNVDANDAIEAWGKQIIDRMVALSNIAEEIFKIYLDEKNFYKNPK